MLLNFQKARLAVETTDTNKPAVNNHALAIIVLLCIHILIQAFLALPVIYWAHYCT
jgi:hypothetical protein